MMAVWVIVLLLLMQEIAGVLRNITDKSITLMAEKPFFSVIWLHGLGDSS
jgi:hypothetical protein